MLKIKCKNITSLMINSREIIVIFLICFLPRLIGTFSMKLTTYVADEISTISTAAILAGGDWSQVLDGVGYYGGGMTIFFVPLFLMLKDPIIIYHIMLACMSLIQAVTGIIAWHILKNYCEIKNSLARCTIAIASSYMVTRRTNNVTNEHILILLTWIIIWTLLAISKYDGNKKKKNILSLNLALLMAYALTVHERGKTYLLALLCLVILYAWVYRKFFISIIPFGTTYLVIYNIAQIFKKFIISHNWPDKLTSVSNAEVHVGNIRELLYPTNWRAWLSCIMGQVTTISMVTGGVFVIALVLAIRILGESVFQRKKYLGDIETGKENKYQFILFTFLFAAIAMTILAQSVSWLSDLVDAYNAGYENNMYSMKVITYIRYFGIYVGPLVMLVLSIIYKCRECVLKHVKVICGLSVLLATYWMIFIWPYISNNTSAIEAFLPFSFQTKWDLSVGGWFYLGGVMFLVICTIAMVLLLKAKKSIIILCGASVLLLYQYGYNTYAFDGQMSSAKEAQELTYRNVFSLAEDLPDTIYISETSSGRIQLTYQLLFFDKQVVPHLPEKNISEGIVITNDFKGNEHLLEEGWKIVKCRNNREDCVFIKGEKLEEKFEKQGIELLEYQSYNKKINSKEVEIIEKGIQKVVLSGKLTSGTYKVLVEGKKVVEHLESITLLSKDVPITEPIDYDSDSVGHKKAVIEFSIMQDYDDVSLMLNQNNREVLEISGITVEKISGTYMVGLDKMEQMQKIIKKVKEITPVSKLYFLNNDMEKKDLGYLKETLPNYQVDFVTELKLLGGTEDVLVLVPYREQEWLPLLQKYSIIEHQSDYILLASRNGVNSRSLSRIWIDAGDGYVNLDFWRIVDENGYITNKYTGLSKGSYMIRLKADNLYPGKLVQIESGDEVWNLMCTQNGEWVFAEISLEYPISEWTLKVLQNDGTEILDVVPQICQLIPGEKDEYDNYILPLIQAAGELSKENNLEIYSQLAEIRDMTQNQTGIKTSSLESMNQEEFDASYVILPNSMNQLFELLEKYTILDCNTKYMLLADSQKMQVVDRNIVPLSEGKSLKKEYFQKTTGSGKYITLPYGSYSISLEIILTGDEKPGEYGYIEIADQNSVFAGETIEITEQEIAARRKTLSVDISSLEDINGLYVSAYGTEEAVFANIEQISQVSEYYEPVFNKLALAGVIYNAEKKVIEAEIVEDGTITSEALSEKYGTTYQYTFTYKAKDPDIVLALYSPETGETIVKTEKWEKIDKGLYQSTLVVKPSTDRNSARIQLRVNYAKDFELQEVKIEKQ